LWIDRRNLGGDAELTNQTTLLGEDFLRRMIIALASGILAFGSMPSQADPTEAPEESVRQTADLPEPPELGACNCTHLIYFVPSDGLDQELDVNGAIAASARAIRTWFSNQMSRAPRMDRIGTSDLYDITFVRGRNPGSTYATMQTLTTELTDRGFDDPAKRYLVYAGLNRELVCGEATFGQWIPGPGYAFVYLDSPNCGSRDLGSQGRGDGLAAHEWLHNEGIAPPNALHHCPTSIHHVCTPGLHLIASSTGIVDPEQPDIMYPYVDTRLSSKVLDRGRDDYLDHGIPVAPDLRNSIFLEAV
jgi:hypothetical protein